MSFDLSQVDLDTAGMMADWPDTMTYDEGVTPIDCIVEDMNSSLVLTDDTYIPGTDLRVTVRVAAVGGDLNFFVSQKQCEVVGRTATFRIIGVSLSSDKVTFTLSLIDAAKL